MVKKQNSRSDIVAVALAANVSASTVSRCFNHPDLVNPTTRRKVDRAVKKLGYIRNRAAQAMHGKRSATIGLIVPTIDHAIFAEVVQAFSTAIEAEGFTTLLASHGYDLTKEYDVLRKLLEHRVDGVALIGLEHSEETFQLLKQQGVPCIAIWNFTEGSKISCVGAENAEAGRLAADHLITLGHREIGTIFPSVAGNDRARDRRDGAMIELEKAGITVPEGWQVESPYNLQQAKQAATELLSLERRPQAMLCGNDVIAQGVIYAAQTLGLHVPDHLSVIGIGDFKGSAEMEPALTTIRIPAQSIGRLAGEEICAAISEDEPALVRHRCELKVLIRATTARSPSVTL
ncbi:transcriptional regulator [Phaeobacter gallaeciensis]|uniref:Transcriptional regulator n=2 Tax=Roseobacteraceae TaxID=2854170 RepID=A0A366X3P0_9RHOB|nr:MULTISPECIES: LacI family DNA-binding transcriptional regulator [Roseobacteraceae]MBT3141304.1 LacI family DNA-binding transcriptional regulator [Falsiruegeria litorea]MBT8166754.1 LacI family DNA-binding transcriptional regulator [Falsiruegeria litorea]RBW56177.1 transcriptional regulator [Phaeobacter gallaeciensis]